MFPCNGALMRPMLVNTKQTIAVLASGLAIATTGFVTDDQASSTERRGTASARVDDLSGTAGKGVRALERERATAEQASPRA